MIDTSCAIAKIASVTLPITGISVPPLWPVYRCQRHSQLLIFDEKLAQTLLQAFQVALPSLFDSLGPLFMSVSLSECSFRALFLRDGPRVYLSEMILTPLRGHHISDANRRSCHNVAPCAIPEEFFRRIASSSRWHAPRGCHYARKAVRKSIWTKVSIGALVSIGTFRFLDQTGRFDPYVTTA